MDASREDQIWNRACLGADGVLQAEGDRALAAMLLTHSFIMNGGVVHALECLSPSEVSDAIKAFNYFGLGEVSSLLRQEPDDSDETEERLNQVYWLLVPGDETLVDAFRITLVASPEAFAPTELGSNS